MSKNKSVTIAVLLAITAFSVLSCTKPKNAPVNNYEKTFADIKENNSYVLIPALNETIEIREKMFVAQVSDVYVNPKDYLGKTIKLQGIFKREQAGSRTYCFVIRYGPGCCGFDANVGFEVSWPRNVLQTYPAVDSWVEAAGVLKTYEEDMNQYLYLDLVSLNVLTTRGMETVRQ